jgi:hypothetical protein
MADFAKGINVKEKTFDNGNSIINISINVEQIFENPINNEKYVNIILKRGKESGKLYAINNEFYPKNSKKVEETEGNTVVTKNVIISQIYLGDLSGKDIEYKVYGKTETSGAKILLLSNIYNTRKEHIEGNGNFAYEGATFDKYIVEITNKGTEAISGTINLLELPRVYMLSTDDY